MPTDGLNDHLLSFDVPKTFLKQKAKLSLILLAQIPFFHRNETIKFDDSIVNLVADWSDLD